jgi:ring-1,2-phenylacetyl-CoA epoxidase subunit PaaD
VVTAPANARAVAESVVDPEMPYVTLGDLGIVGQVDIDPDGALTVDITPTYAACPAMAEIKYTVHQRLCDAGFATVRLRTVLDPPWSTDRITAAGRAKLLAAGIAPPPGPSTEQAEANFVAKPAPGGCFATKFPPTDSVTVLLGRAAARTVVACPRCGSDRTELLSRFSGTACKALYRCVACTEPFEQIKAV